MIEAGDIKVVSGNPTPEELAAVVAVLEGMTQELEGTRARAAARAASAWRLSQRPIRTPIVSGVSRWRGFP
ncbi:hypothetical protein GCM10022239_09080 [Leifsonia bigeumensis]|uniref:Acyl-CoA carboxylase subunit epsilon n=1 Tax=Leifsonella bigeumensis TaxID=433643 RepID=A0ABP7FAW3_9MICO|nr:acyl-CoA carboxylase subunit epsilon [Terrimesophilobacter sp.]